MDIVAIGVSAGGLQALSDILAELPAQLPATILAVVHTPPERTSNLPTVLSRAGALPVQFATRDQVLGAVLALFDVDALKRAERWQPPEAASSS